MEDRTHEILIDGMLELLADTLLLPLLEVTGFQLTAPTTKQSFGTVSARGVIQFESVYQISTEVSAITLTVHGLLGNPKHILGFAFGDFSDGVTEAATWDRRLFFTNGLANEAVFAWEVPTSLTCGSAALDWSLLGLRFELLGYTRDGSTRVRGTAEVPTASLRQTYARQPWEGCRPASLDEEDVLWRAAEEQGFWL